MSLTGRIFEKNKSGFGLAVYFLTMRGHRAIRGVRSIEIRLSFSLDTPLSINFRNTTESVANAILFCFLFVKYLNSLFYIQ